MRRCLILLALLLAAPAARGATVQVDAFNFGFNPEVVNINVGDTVIWTGLAFGGHNVVADDGSFRSGNIGSLDTFSHTFNSPGSFRYICEPHEGLGMTGIVNVSGGGGGEQAGTLKVAGATANVTEGNTVSVQILRINGDDGAVSVSYAVTALTAQGNDFTAASGTINWADNDDDPKTITVSTVEDTAAEGNETVRVTLSNPTGGAALDNNARITTVTIQDDDSGGTPPTAPSNLQVHAHSTTEVMLSWTDSSGETGYRIERKTLGGDFQEVATAPANSGSAILGGQAEATFYTFRVRAENASGFSGYSNEAGTATLATPGPCLVSSTTLCLNNGRFEVDVDWRAGANAGPATAIPLELAPDSGLFYFFSQSNIEMLVKVLNACVPALGEKYWVFYAATTNVEFTLTVTDTQTGVVKVYFNPENNPAQPIQDTGAFSTCP